MRADRLVSLVLLLRRQGRMTAPQLAHELEVSTRTVIRDMEALSAAGVPVYAERGRHGGYALLPGFRAELTGLNHDEAVALFAAASSRAESALGLSAALASAMRKIVDALPEPHRASASGAAERLLVEPETDLLSRRVAADDVPREVMAQVRRAVLDGRKLRIRYAARGHDPSERVVDPIGLVTVRERAYLLALRAGVDRTYRLSRMVEAEVLADAAERPDRADLEATWRERSARFRAGGDTVEVSLLVDPGRRDHVLDTALAVRAEEAEPDGRLRLEVTFQDLWHAEWAAWQLGAAGEVVRPAVVRARVRERALALAERYADRA